MNGETGASSLSDVADSIHADAGTAGAAANTGTETGVEQAAETITAGDAGRAEAEAAAAADPSGSAAAEAAADDGEDPVFELQIGDKVEELKASEIAELIEKARTSSSADGDIETIRAEVDAQKEQLAEHNTNFVRQVGEAALLRLNHLSGLVDALSPQDPDISLLRTDPDGYHEQKHIFELFAQVKGQLDAERDAAAGNITNARQQGQSLSVERQQSLVQAEQRHLLEAIPELREPEKAKAFLVDAAALAKELGFSQAEFDGAVDHRMFKLLKMAMAGRKAPIAAEQRRANIRMKIAGKPPVARTANGQFQVSSAANQAAQQRVNERGGRTSDIAALIDAGG